MANGQRYYPGQGDTPGDIPALVAGPDWRPEPGFMGRGPLDTGQQCDNCGFGPEDHEWHPEDADFTPATSGSYWDSSCEHYTLDGQVLDDSGYTGGQALAPGEQWA